MLDELSKKKEASWHYALPMMNFVSTFELDRVEGLMEKESLFKKSCLSLFPVQQRDALELIVCKYLKYLSKHAESVEV
jgi:hypothetical protein